MKVGYGKGKYASSDGYHIIKNVVGVDIVTKEGFGIIIRESGYRVTKGSEFLTDANFKELDKRKE